ncbi:GWxTD domain-containing protein [candidate division KSB1 bacterium]|nr:GWxTD domain-containing protein [candidate division KSB1 bacterium]
MEYRNNGDLAEAVKSWVSGGQALQRQQKADPRIGIAFIELITEIKAVKYYEMACEMYLWGFSQGGMQKYNRDVENEVERIAPLLNKDMRKKWHSLFKKNDPQLFIEIKSFWVNKDPTPTTATNERLLEHWQRIAHARKNFRNSKNTVYGTDDRGLIYVKYGEPERMARGSLGSRRGSFKRWADFLTGEGLIGANDAETRSGGGQRAAQEDFLIREIDRYNNYPEYEIWFYHSLNTDEPISYMFGNHEGIGLYGLRNGVEDFIPGRAFLRTSSNRTGGISPGAVLQSVYYSELMHLHPDFEDRYFELERIWDSLASGRSPLVINSSFRMKRQNFKTADIFNPLTAFAPPEKSSFDQTISKVKMLVSPFRFLNEEGIPNIALITLSYPQIRMDYIKTSAEKNFPDYSVSHTVIAYDRNHNEIRRLNEALQSGDDNISTFILPHEDLQSDFMLVTEVFNSLTTSKAAPAGEFDTSPQIIALGRTNVPSPRPLSASHDLLELSDLLIGVSSPSELESKSLPFPLVPSSRILATDLLKIYFEIYHLYFDEDGVAHYSIDFEVARLKGKKKEKKESISLSFNFDAYKRMSKEQFEMDISNLTPGYYELSVQVTDKVSLQKRGRKARFEIVDVGKHKMF